jgi:hypothetical protein
MTKARSEPRISVNKLAQYVTSRAARQNQILRNAKFPPDYITTYYREASEAISRYLAVNLSDGKILDNAVNALNQKDPSNVYESRRIAGNIDAIETLASMLDDIDFLAGTQPRLGAQIAPHLTMHGVGISVRPEVTLHTKGLVGGIKLHFPKTEPLDKEEAGYVAALVQSFCETHLWKEGSSHHEHCMVIDLASAKVYPGVKAIKQRIKDVQNACMQISSLWPTITE